MLAPGDFADLTAPPPREVSSKTFAAWWADRDCARLAAAASRPYARSLSADDRLSCVMEALWSALRQHDFRRRRKFSSSLFTFVKWKCLREVRRQGCGRERFHRGLRPLPALGPARAEPAPVWETLDCLPGLTAEVAGRHAAGQSKARIARETGLTAYGVEKRLAEAAAGLREEYGG